MNINKRKNIKLLSIGNFIPIKNIMYLYDKYDDNKSQHQIRTS